MTETPDYSDEEREAAALLAQLRAVPAPAARERAFAQLQRDFTALQPPAARPSARGLERRSTRWAMAAGIAFIAFAGVSLIALRPTAVLARVEALDGDAVARASHWFSSDARLAAAADIHAGDSLTVGANGGVLLRISPDLTVRLAAGTHARFAAADRIELAGGTAFVDATPGAHAPLRIVTPHGDVTHLGTQYLVLSTPRFIEVAVREGRAQFGTAVPTVVEAGHWMRLLRGPDNAPASGELGDSDVRFAWVAGLPSEFRLEGATLPQFLEWFRRESGLTPVYSAGLNTGDLASVHLRGSIEHLEPLDALSTVLETADLAWHREGAKVIIEKRPAAGN